MGTITTLRPSGTSSGVGWSAQPSGTLHGVTSDDSDLTYALWSGSGSALVLTTPLDAPPLGELRHQVRLRARGEDGDAFWAVQLTTGQLIAAGQASLSSSPSTVIGSWGFGAPADGSIVLSTYLTAQSSVVRIQELYLDVDTRLAPVFTPQVLDGSGTSTTTVSDTAQPSLRANAVDLDDLNARSYRYWVTLNGAIVWDTGVVGGSALTRQVTTALDNGTYVAHFQVSSTIGADTAYTSDEETVTFTVSVGSIPAPDNPVVSQVPDTPFYSLEVCAPFAGDFDDDEAYIEIQRVDCPTGGYLALPGLTGSYASTPDPGPTTDLQVTVRARRTDDWRPTADDALVAQFNSGGDQRSWRLVLDADGGGDPALAGRPYLAWSTDGTAGTEVIAEATSRPPIDAFGEVILRATLDTDDGAGGWTVLFETQDLTGTWVQLGDLVTNSGGGTTSIFDSTSPIEVGARNDGTAFPFTGSVFWAEVRNGAAGALIASPDFTGRMAGTTSFTDDQANVWTVSGNASITSDQRLVSISILGPLDTDECATYVDYTLPRTGVGATCTHQPEPCCSYYRARTVGRIDGQLQISNWSDAFDPGVPNGVIFMWPSTNASIPAGWDRVTALDSRYTKGIATSSTEPGTTGGAPDHTHTLASHTHDTSHVHTITGNTGAATGTQVSTPNAAGTANVLSSHTHTRSSVNSSTVVSGGTVGTAGSINNDPVRLNVIYIESNGQPLGVPNGALAYTLDVSLSGWANYGNATNRFLKGAVAAGDGGGQAGSPLPNHVHSVAAHTHTGTSHTHTSPNTGSVSSVNSLTAGGTPVLSQTSHSHTVTVGSASTAALSASSPTDTGATSPDLPPYRNLRAQENTSGDDSLPLGIIGIWRGSLGAIPDFWSLCDGTGGTPDMIGRYPRAATASIDTTGGSLNAHSHTSASHTHTTSGHSHTETVNSAAATTGNVSTTSTVTVSTGTHTHSAADTNSTTPTVAAGSGAVTSTVAEPLYEEVAFIQLTEEPTPPPAPDLFCLEWDEDHHLLRTEGVDGPLWAAVGGMFSWDVDRPFTSATGVMGGRYVTSAPPGGRNLHLSTAVESEAELATLQAVLNRPLVLVSPSDAEEVWVAPVAASVRVIKIGRVRQVTVDFIATGPQPSPQLADVGA